MSPTAAVAVLPAPADVSPSTSGPGNRFGRVAVGDLAARDALIAAHLPLVKHIAGCIRGRLGACPEHDELISAGTLGLLQAIDAFDPSRGHTFSTFATPRIRGAILDALRWHDHAPRSRRRKVRGLAAAETALAQEPGRTPNDRELADRLGMPVEAVWRWRFETEGATPCSLDAPASGHAGQPSRGTSTGFADLAVPTDAAPDTTLEQTERLAILRAGIASLTARGQTVLALYYLEGPSMKGVAQVLEVTESRISQLHMQALRRLRAAMAATLVQAA